MITKIAFVAHPTKDMESMRRFYGEHLGLDQSAECRFADMWCEFKARDGKTVALDTFSAQAAPSAPYMALETDDIEAEVQRLKSFGVTVARDVWANNNEDGRENCKMAIVTDPDGNAVMLHQTAAWRLEG